MGERDTWDEEVDMTGAFQKTQWCLPSSSSACQSLPSLEEVALCLRK